MRGDFPAMRPSCSLWGPRPSPASHTSCHRVYAKQEPLASLSKAPWKRRPVRTASCQQEDDKLSSDTRVAGPPGRRGGAQGTWSGALGGVRLAPTRGYFTPTLVHERLSR